MYFTDGIFAICSFFYGSLFLASGFNFRYRTRRHRSRPRRPYESGKRITSQG